LKDVFRIGKLRKLSKKIKLWIKKNTFTETIEIVFIEKRASAKVL